MRQSIAMAEENSIEYSIMQTLDDEDDAKLIAENRQRLERSLLSQGPWGYSNKGLEARRAAMTMLSTKHGMYARIPLICKGETCPYVDTCQLLKYDVAPVGEYCPMETAQIELRVVEYVKDIGLDETSFTDQQLLNDIVGYDIMLERCRALMAKEGTPVVDMVVGISENGEEIRQPSVSKAWEAYEKIVKKRNETYQLMLMTRKDNKKSGDDDTGSLHDVLANVISSADFEEVSPDET